MKYLARILLLEPLVLTGLVAFTDYTPKNGFMAYLFSIICLVFGAILIIHDNDQRRDS